MARKRQPVETPLPRGLECGCEVTVRGQRGTLLSDCVTDGMVCIQFSEGLESVQIESLFGTNPVAEIVDIVQQSDGPLIHPTVPIEPKKGLLSGLGDKVHKAQTPKAIGGPPHLIVQALAGTGKTTTIVEGLKLVRGMTPSITPSPQQQAIWDSMALSKGARSVVFCAFNKSIAQELEKRVPQGCQARTMHSLGFEIVRRTFSGVGLDKYKVEGIIAEILGKDTKRVRREDPVILKATKQLVDLVKMNLTPLDDDGSEDAQHGIYSMLGELADHYEVEMTEGRYGRGKSYEREVFDLVPKVINRCKDVAATNSIDHADMIWLPIVLNLPCPAFDLMLVDEGQDMNRCQQELARKCGDRLIIVGDKNQAIYAWAGADSKSLENMERMLKGTARGCVTLPLTVTRRCGKRIVEEARKLVPAFEALPDAHDGEVRQSTPDQYRYPIVRDQDGTRELPMEVTYLPHVRDGDMIICRVNGPLVSQCFRLIRMGRRANIIGRNVAEGLINLIERLGATGVPDLITRAHQWLTDEMTKENAKPNPDDGKLIRLTDTVECILALTEQVENVPAVINRINQIFSDDTGRPGVRLSSIHKAKGLEADNVWFLMPKGAQCPHPLAQSEWQQEQEYNCLYVGQTRAIHTLTFVR